MLGFTADEVMADKPELSPNPFNSFRDLLLSMEDDFAKFYDKGNNAASARVVKGPRDSRLLSQRVRVETKQGT